MAVSKPSSSPPRRRPDDSAENGRATAVSPKEGEPGHRRALPMRLTAALIAAGVWLIFLAALVVFTANPTTLNRAQLRAAPIVVEAAPIADEPGRWRVARSWPFDSMPPRIEVQGIESLRLAERGHYLIPVEPLDKVTYRIVRTPRPEALPLIYPATPETVAELEAILGDRMK